MYDTIIVGGGIAGLTIAEHFSSTKPSEKTLILERYPNWGGRIVTNHEPYEYEIGAGRINKTHKRVGALVKRFNLKTYPIENTKTGFDELFEPICQVLKTLPKNELGQHTISELVPKELHPIFRMFAYYAEIHLLRADLALPLFEKNEAMNSGAEYYGIKGGLDQLVGNLSESIDVEFRSRYRVEDIKKQPDGTINITGSCGKKAEATPFALQCKKVIIATEYRSFKDFSILKNSDFLNHLVDSPLTRIYAVYPKTQGNGNVWFHDIEKTVTDSPLRYVIPINAKSGLIMISYTDGKDTEVWNDLTDKDLKQTIQAEVRRLFPKKTIPDPIYLKKHAWSQGCTYWRKGKYDLDKTLLEAQNPRKNVYICGESVNRTQSWIESALESAENLIKIIS